MERRPDYGFGNAILNLMLYPRNPFNIKPQRELKPRFLFGVAWIGVAITLLVFFNFGIGRF